VFGRKLLAKSPEIAAEWSTKLGVDALTLDGDLVSRKGALTGGYVDTNQSRIQAHSQLREATQQLRESERALEGLQRDTQKWEREVSKAMQEIQRLESKRGDWTNQMQQTEKELERLQSRLDQHQRQAEHVERAVIPPLERELEVIQSDINRLQAEIGTPLQQSLSDEERESLQQVKQRLGSISNDVDAQNERVSQASVERQKWQSLLQDNLYKRRQELNRGKRLSTAAVQEHIQQELKDRQRELMEAIRVREEVEERLNKARQEEDEIRSELIAAKNKLEQLKSKDQKNAKALEDSQDKSERLLNKVCLSFASVHVCVHMCAYYTTLLVSLLHHR
jgi:structural maintenance of chromosome 3 (chondroitin sulfate proteoglycan 6)